MALRRIVLHCPRFKLVRHSSALSSLSKDLQKDLDSIKDAGTYKNERIILGKQGVSINVQNKKEPILNFCANNYLGLSSHPAVIEAGKQALETHGAGMSSVRFICGTQDIHRTLEKQLAKFHCRDDAILYAACFDANTGLFEVILGQEDAVICDSLNHASIIDGVRLCKAQRHIYKHMDIKELEDKLIATKATDGVFSMDGNIAPLDKICELAGKHNALVFVDDCHSTGFFGPTGRGTEEYLGVMGRVDIISSTLGKALGGAMGGYTTGPRQLIDLLRQKSRPYLFSNSLAPSVVGSSSKVIEMLLESSDFSESLLHKTHQFRTKMTAAGFVMAGSKDHPICPVMLGDAKLASEFADRMLHLGIYVIGFSFPVVPKGEARIRVQISAAHTPEQIDQCIAAFIEVATKLKVIGQK